jgi:AraC-like DNA-binding protein
MDALIQFDETGTVMTGGPAMRKRLFSFYLALLLPPTLVFLSIGYWVVAQHETEKVRLECQAALSAACETVGALFARVQSLAQTLAEESWVRKVAFMQSADVDSERFDAMERNKAVHALASNAHALDASLLAVIFPAKDYAVSSYYLHSLAMFLGTDAVLDAPGADAWRAMALEGLRPAASAPGTLTYLSYQRKAVGYAVPIPLTGFHRSQAVLVAYLDVSAVQRALAASASGGIHLMAQADGTDAWVYADSADADIALLPASPGWWQWDGARVLHAQKASTSLGWTFHGFMQDVALRGRLVPLRIGYVSLLVSLASLMAALAWFLAAKRSAPLLRMRALLDASGNLPGAPPRIGKPRGNVYQGLEDAVTAMLEERRKQNDQLRQYRPQLRGYYLHRLLEDGADAIPDSALALVGIAFPYRIMRCLAVRGENAGLLADCIREEAIKQDVSEYSVMYGDVEMVLLNYQEEQRYERLRMAVQSLADAAPWEGGALSARVGVGMPVGPGSLADSARLAVEALGGLAERGQIFMEWQGREASPPGAAADRHGSLDQRGDAIRRYIEEHAFDRELSLGQVAAHFGLSDSYAVKLLKGSAQTTYLDFVNRQRVGRAKALLKNTDAEIKDIALEIGYDSDITFRRVFKKLEGLTPGQYRIVERKNNG